MQGADLDAHDQMALVSLSIGMAFVIDRTGI
jgi:hypothetical protein